MGERNGDPAKQPPECKPVFTPFSAEFPKSIWDVGYGKWSTCPNLYESGGDMETEVYNCDVCGKYYTLYYEDMK
jgi:hypothetical protein